MAVAGRSGDGEIGRGYIGSWFACGGRAGSLVSRGGYASAGCCRSRALLLKTRHLWTNLTGFFRQLQQVRTRDGKCEHVDVVESCIYCYLR